MVFPKNPYKTDWHIKIWRLLFKQNLILEDKTEKAVKKLQYGILMYAPVILPAIKTSTSLKMQKTLIKMPKCKFTRNGGAPIITRIRIRCFLIQLTDADH